MKKDVVGSGGIFFSVITCSRGSLYCAIGMFCLERYDKLVKMPLLVCVREQVGESSPVRSLLALKMWT